MTKTLSIYTSRTMGDVARIDTDGQFFWLADLNGKRLSGPCGNRAEVTMAAFREFGPVTRPSSAPWR
jgi:hypothetical protein